jgi:hypothetical protein
VPKMQNRSKSSHHYLRVILFDVISRISYLSLVELCCSLRDKGTSGSGLVKNLTLTVC